MFCAFASWHKTVVNPKIVSRLSQDRMWIWALINTTISISRRNIYYIFADLGRSVDLVFLAQYYSHETSGRRFSAKAVRLVSPRRPLSSLSRRLFTRTASHRARSNQRQTSIDVRSVPRRFGPFTLPVISPGERVERRLRLIFPCAHIRTHTHTHTFIDMCWRYSLLVVLLTRNMRSVPSFLHA